MSRDSLAKYLEQTLDINRFRDYCPNGLQVEGREHVDRIVTGVSASLELLSAATDAGADAISVVNTVPGLVIDVERRTPVLGFGTGGVSGPAILPIGVLATFKVRRAVRLPILGVGGVASGTDALQYILAGASLVGIGTAAMRDPRAPERVVSELDTWCRRHGVTDIQTLIGALEWPKQ